MPQARSRWLLLLVPVVLAGSTWTDGKALIEQGQYVEACQHWATALATDPGDKGARKGMKKYGMILADNGSNFYFQGIANAGWTEDDIEPLKDVPASAFEVVQMPPLMP